MTVFESPWHNLRGWLGVKNQSSIYPSLFSNYPVTLVMGQGHQNRCACSTTEVTRWSGTMQTFKGISLNSLWEKVNDKVFATVNLLHTLEITIKINHFTYIHARYMKKRSVCIICTKVEPNRIRIYLMRKYNFQFDIFHTSLWISHYIKVTDTDMKG